MHVRRRLIKRFKRFESKFLIKTQGIEQNPNNTFTYLIERTRKRKRQGRGRETSN